MTSRRQKGGHSKGQFGLARRQFRQPLHGAHSGTSEFKADFHLRLIHKKGNITLSCNLHECVEGSMETLLPFPITDARDALSDFEQILTANSGEDAFDVAIRLLAAKLLDEIELRDGKSAAEFTTNGTSRAIHKRVGLLYDRAIDRWPELDGSAVAANVAPEQLSRCLRPLVGWSILGSDLSHLDAVLERLVARGAKSELGQYFTPRDVVRLCVIALNPCPRDTVVDPACGSGGFLYEAVRYSVEANNGVPSCLGIDIGAKALKVAHLLSHAVGNGVIRVSKANSIDGRAYRTNTPPEWGPFLDTNDEDKNGECPWGAWHKLRFSLLLTNPPFAGDIDESDVLSVYESQRSQLASRKGTVGREHLFVERAVNLLGPGGRLAIVVPQGILANSTSSYLRRWLFARCRVLAVVGLHPYAFLPYTGVKASVLFLEKPPRHENPPPDYPIAFMVSGLPGKDSSGRLAGKSDYDKIAVALALFFHSQQLKWAVRKAPRADGVCEPVMMTETARHDRLDAEYHAHDVRRLYLQLHGTARKRIADVVARSIDRFRRSSSQEIDYLDISSVDARTGLAVPSRLEARDAPSRASYVAVAGDVLVSTVRPERNTVALVSKKSDVPLVASNGFCLLRPTGIAPELLYAYCKTASFRKLLARRATATMYPAVTDRDVLDMPFVEPPSDTQTKVVEEMRLGIQKLEQAQRHIAQAVATMEDFLKEAALGGAASPPPPSVNANLHMEESATRGARDEKPVERGSQP